MYICIYFFSSEKEAVNPAYTLIQGSRTSGSSPWVDDDGNTQPYLAPTVENGNNPVFDSLEFISD